MIAVFITGSTLFMTAFIYSSLVVAKKADEDELKEEGKLNWKK